jgi:transposase
MVRPCCTVRGKPLRNRFSRRLLPTVRVSSSRSNACSPGTWRADLWAHEGLAFVSGHALDMPAIHGGQAKNDQIASHQIATRLRGGMLPLAYVSPAERRATRDLVRRRTHLRRTRAARLAHGHNTNAPDHLPDSGQTIADQANRAGVAARFHDPAGPKTLEVDLALVTSDDARLRDLALAIVQTAKPHAAHPLSLRQTVPGSGKLLSRVLLDELPDLGRVPSVQDVASDARVVQGRTASAGPRVGPSGKKIGHAHLTWACSDAATLFLRTHPNGHKRLTRVEKTHGKGQALTLLAPTVARAVSDRLTRTPAFEMALFLHA